jgi:hypothetical protein
MHPTSTTPTTNRRAPAVRMFVRHYLEMVAAMFVGMALFAPVGALIFSWLGAAALLERPDVSALMMATTMTLGMTLWMRYRRHSWASTLEMGAVMYLSFAVVLVPFWLGVFDREAVMIAGHVLMLVGMLVSMLRRRAEMSA